MGRLALSASTQPFQRPEDFSRTHSLSLSLDLAGTLCISAAESR